MAFQNEGPGEPGEARVERYRRIGSVSGTIIGALAIFVFLGFGEHPHRLGEAVIATVIFLILATALDLFVHSQKKRRKSLRSSE